MGDSIRVSGTVPVAPEDVLRAWLDSAAHSAFTGGVAFIEPVVGGRFSAWDGYIEGTTIAIEGARIVQAWRTSEFPESAPDSRLEILVEATDDGTLVTLVHSGIPRGQGDRYEDGWMRWYLVPMREYFGNVSSHPKEYSETGEFPTAELERDDSSVERERSSPPPRRAAKPKAAARTKTPSETKSKKPPKAKTQKAKPSETKTKKPSKTKTEKPSKATTKKPSKATTKKPSAGRR